MSQNVYIVQSKVRALAKKKGCRLSGEALDRLSVVVTDAVIQAAERAKANKRHTIKGCDV